ncbi:MAG: STAS-like domain-containing protein [Desulfarculus sp.]|nr:STAS-like domain-containing protein [Desulfarculus sp.]
MAKNIINIASDFSQFPAGRYRSDGGFSGELFRDDFLVPSLNEFDVVEVILDGAEGYGSSFLEESFGGLVREKGFSEADLKKRLVIVCSSPEFETYKEEAWQHIHDAEKAKRVK